MSVFILNRMLKKKDISSYFNIFEFIKKVIQTNETEICNFLNIPTLFFKYI